MNVFYTCDDNYVWLMGISMISLFENNKQLNKLKIYLLGNDISEGSKRKLAKIGDKYNREIIIIDATEIVIPDELISKRWPLSAFIRLFSGELLPADIEKVLYLDCDTIITDSIEKLEDFEVSKKTFWGVKDCVGNSYKRNIGLNNDEKYINAGVLLINLVKLRSYDMSLLIHEYLKKYIRYINYADQDILNGVFHEDIGILAPQYNVMTISTVYQYDEIIVLRKPTGYYSREELEHAIKYPQIVHYTTNMRTIRPWYNNTNHPYAKYFLKYFRISPWKNLEFQEFVFSSRESKITGVIQRLPRRMANWLLGVAHSELKPIYIRVRAVKKSLRRQV